jgi:aerotaxis receptor
LKKGQPWRGVIKNRAKNGDYYWVDSFVMPIMSDGKTIGYQSVRRRASREDIVAAEQHYQAMTAGNPPPRYSCIRFERWLSIRSGITLGIAYVALILLAGALVGLGIMRQAETELRTMYHNKVQAGDTLARIKFLMADNRAQILLGLMHDPANPLSASHDHPIARHIAAVDQSRSEIERLWNTFRHREMTEATAQLADRYWAARMNYLHDGLESALRELDAGHFREANRLVGSKTNRLYERANTLADELMQHLLHDAEASYRREQERHTLIQQVVLAGIVVALLILAVSGFLFFRGIMAPLERGIANLQRIGEGDLSGDVEFAGGGEIGRFNCALAMTQAQLQVMTEEAANGVALVGAECGLLNSTVQQISNGIDEAHERIYLITDRLAESVQAMSKLSQQSEAVLIFAERSVSMAQAAGKEFSELLMRLLLVADAVLLFRSQLVAVEAALGNHPDSLQAGAAAPPAMEKSAAALTEIRKVIASLSALGEKIEQEKPWDMAHCSAQRVVEELGGELAGMARELATETRIQSFASEDAQREIGKIALFLVETREAMHVLWHTSTQLSELAATLENTSARFKRD